jgi:hypothetical protein
MDDFQIVTVAAAHEILRPMVAGELMDEGFQDVGILKWVRSADAPIRQVLCFQQWKGGVLAPSWGVSLDFVPHVSGSSVKWHRTPKSAMLDLRVDARDRDLDLPYHHGPKPLLERGPQVVRKGVDQAQTFWARSKRLPDLLGAFEWLKDYYGTRRGMGFYNFVQHPVALASVLAFLGRTTEAVAELERYGPARDEAIKAELWRRIASRAAE